MSEDFDPLRGVSLELDRFFEAEEKRDRILEMQDRIRPKRTKPIAIRLDQFTVRRLKTLATLHNVGYQTLLKEFVVERLYEEERRAGIVPGPPPFEQVPGAPPSPLSPTPPPPERADTSDADADIDAWLKRHFPSASG